MGLVDKRLRLKYGEQYGISVEHEPENSLNENSPALFGYNIIMIKLPL